jgi:mannose-1-phosphate guanylyltransferase
MTPPRPMNPAPTADLSPPRRRPWAIVLAGGEGTRLRDYVTRRFGEARPKQYCAFSGRRSMLQHTVDRAAWLAGPTRTVTVVARQHLRWARPQLWDRGGELVVQPSSRDTAPGVFLPLCWVKARDPEAVVYVLPSDHFIAPERRFLDQVAAAGAVARTEAGRVVLCGVEPDGVETEYGYIEPRASRDHVAHEVASFVEKPDQAAASAAIGRGALWNTMIMAGTVDAFWQAGRATLPEMMDCFDLLVDAIDTPAEGPTLEAIYRRLPRANFSHDVLGRAPDRCLVTRLAGIEWSDWGRAERIEHTVARLKRAPARPATSADAVGAA